tara:strand:+ start:638 stop:772 length:135 start_codon:yes stop_codon:yes gene_type:complete
MKITQKNKDKLLEWGIILVPLVALILYKYLAWGCLFVCGDWYDE